MINTLDDIEPPYRSGDSDKVTRSPTWPRADDAKKRIEVMIDGRAADNVTIDVVDLIVVMREIGRLTPENAKLVAALKTLRVRLASLPDTCAIIDAALAAAGQPQETYEEAFARSLAFQDACDNGGAGE